MHESYTMQTQNVDAHPILRRMHKPDPRLPKDAREKRKVVEQDEWDQRLEAKPEQEKGLIRGCRCSLRSWMRSECALLS